MLEFETLGLPHFAGLPTISASNKDFPSTLKTVEELLTGSWIL